MKFIKGTLFFFGCIVGLCLFGVACIALSPFISAWLLLKPNKPVEQTEIYKALQKLEEAINPDLKEDWYKKHRDIYGEDE